MGQKEQSPGPLEPGSDSWPASRNLCDHGRVLFSSGLGTLFSKMGHLWGSHVSQCDSVF